VVPPFLDEEYRGEIPVLSSCWLVPLIIIDLGAVLSPVLFTGGPERAAVLHVAMSYCVSFTASHGGHSRSGCAGLEACCPRGLDTRPMQVKYGRVDAPFQNRREAGGRALANTS